jgi:RsmE family RNA methyltransferase
MGGAANYSPCGKAKERMNLILLFVDDFVSEGRARLTGRRLAHVRSVHRVGTGDALRVGLLGGKKGTGRIAHIDDFALDMDVELDQEPPPKLPLTLIVALPRPKALNRIVAAATSLGASSLVLLNTWKVEKSYWKSPRLSESNLLHQRILGLEQAADTVLPNLRIERLFTPFVRDALPILGEGSTRLLAHPGACAPCPSDAKGPCTLALGPEGGFVASEVAALEDAGFLQVGLGARTLRVETAMAVSVGRLFCGGQHWRSEEQGNERCGTPSSVAGCAAPWA